MLRVMGALVGDGDGAPEVDLLSREPIVAEIASGIRRVILQSVCQIIARGLPFSQSQGRQGEFG